MPKKKEVELYVAYYDAHYPQINRPTLKALLEFLDHNEVDGFLFGGDQLDCAEISHHNKGKGLYKLPGSYKRNLDGFDKEVLSEIEARLPKHAKKIWLEGNHEYWSKELVEEHPELQGTVEVELILKVAERGWRHIDFGKSFKHGELTFVHGQELGGCGNQNATMHAKKALEVFCTNVLYGHYHNPQSFTKILPTDVRRKWQAHCAPIGGDVNPKYIENRPTAWLCGWVIIEFRPDGEFNLYPVICIDGVASYGGKTYGTPENSRNKTRKKS